MNRFGDIDKSELEANKCDVISKKQDILCLDF